MTDSEIVNALENEIHLAEYVDSDYCSNTEVSLLKSTLDLINRLQARVEYYKQNRNKYQDDVMYLSKQLDNLQAENERLKAYILLIKR